jgi:hypothetical protein
MKITNRKSQRFTVLFFMVILVMMTFSAPISAQAKKMTNPI